MIFRIFLRRLWWVGKRTRERIWSVIWSVHVRSAMWWRSARRSVVKPDSAPILRLKGASVQARIERLSHELNEARAELEVYRREGVHARTVSAAREEAPRVVRSSSASNLDVDVTSKEETRMWGCRWSSWALRLDAVPSHVTSGGRRSAARCSANWTQWELATSALRRNDVNSKFSWQCYVVNWRWSDARARGTPLGSILT